MDNGGLGFRMGQRSETPISLHKYYAAPKSAMKISYQFSPMRINNDSGTKAGLQLAVEVVALKSKWCQLIQRFVNRLKFKDITKLPFWNSEVTTSRHHFPHCTSPCEITPIQHLFETLEAF